MDSLALLPSGCPPLSQGHDSEAACHGTRSAHYAGLTQRATRALPQWEARDAPSGGTGMKAFQARTSSIWRERAEAPGGLAVTGETGPHGAAGKSQRRADARGNHCAQPVLRVHCPLTLAGQEGDWCLPSGQSGRWADGEPWSQRHVASEGP